MMPARARLRVRRAVFLMLVLATMALLAQLMLGMIRMNGTTPLEAVGFALTVLLLLPIVFSFWMAVAGFVVELGVHDPLALDVPAVDGEEPLPPTALVVPIRNEDPARVLAGLGATWETLERTGRSAAFEIFLQSDTTDPRRWIEEELAASAFAAQIGPGRVHYRNRPSNEGRKAGNIADFCQNWGERFRYMVIFDADSVMDGETLVRLVQLMQRHPDAGIIQAPPLPVGRLTLFGRLQQFAAGVYGRTWAAGLVWLQDGEGNYYGHNAIVRIAPFMEHCRLPMLPGEAPLGGSILSHDFVEAALMRRAGWKVHLVADLGGSFEEPPATLLDFAARDRRWCQGNLQHARLLGLPGLHLMSRLHLLLGVMAYLSAPLWILLLLLSTAETLRWVLSSHQYFPPGGSLFPVWEISIEAQATLLFSVVLALLFLPRALALLSRWREARLFGGGGRLLLSVVAEALSSVLLAPVMAVLQTRCVLSILSGHSSGWHSVSRGDRGTSLGEAVRHHAGTTLLGLLWAVLLGRLAPALLWWMLPVLAGMALSIPFSMLSSHVSAGRRARRLGLFLTPEEVSPPRVLRSLHARLAARPQAPADPRSALERVLADPAVRGPHLAFSPPPRDLDPLARHRLAGLVVKARLHGPAALDDAEQRELLLHPEALIELAGPAAAPRRAGHGG